MITKNAAKDWAAVEVLANDLLETARRMQGVSTYSEGGAVGGVDPEYRDRLRQLTEPLLSFLNEAVR